MYVGNSLYSLKISGYFSSSCYLILFAKSQIYSSVFLEKTSSLIILHFLDASFVVPQCRSFDLKFIIVSQYGH